MRVFFLQRSKKYDITAAEEHGELVFITDEFLSPFDPEALRVLVRKRLFELGFDTEEDAICFTGPSILVAQFVAVVVHDYEKVTTLLFDARTSKYVSRVMNLGEVG